jgi:mannosyltransferase OCH1-like enzyme
MTIHLISTLPKNQWPPIWKTCYNIWKNSSYTIKLWGAEEIDKELKEDDSEFYEVLKTIPDIYSIDYVRYIILEKYGGAYFDLDVEIVNNFIHLLNPNIAYFAEGDIGEYAQNSIIISNRDNIFWNRLKLFTKFKILNNLDQDLTISNNVLKISGPLSLSEFLLKFKDKFLPETKVELLSIHHFGNPDSSLCFAKHHRTNTWQR